MLIQVDGTFTSLTINVLGRITSSLVKQTEFRPIYVINLGTPKISSVTIEDVGLYSVLQTSLLSEIKFEIDNISGGNVTVVGRVGE